MVQVCIPFPKEVDRSNNFRSVQVDWMAISKSGDMQTSPNTFIRIVNRVWTPLGYPRPNRFQRCATWAPVRRPIRVSCVQTTRSIVVRIRQVSYVRLISIWIVNLPIPVKKTAPVTNQAVCWGLRPMSVPGPTRWRPRVRRHNAPHLHLCLIGTRII